METWLKAARDQAARLGEDIQKQAILLADDAGQKGKREVTFRAGPMGFELEGVHVAFVEPDGQAQQQGVCPGDKLISIAGYVIPENPKEESVKRWLDEMIRPGRLTFMTEAKSGASSLPPAVAFPKESDGGESLGEDGWQDSDFAVPADMLDDASSSRRSPDLEPSPEARLRAELYAAKDEARSLERELEDCRAECHELRHFAAEKADGSLAATRSEERLLRLNDQVALQRKESEELRKRNRELQAQLETLSSTCDELRRESAQNEDRAMEAMESRSQVLEEEVQRLRATVHELKSQQQSSLRSVEQELRDSQDRTEELEKRLAHAAQERTELEGMMQEAEARASAVEKEADAARRELCRLEAGNMSEVEEIQRRHEREVWQLQERIREMQAEKANKVEAEAEKEAPQEEQEEKVSTVSGIIAGSFDAVEDVGELQARIHVLETQCATLQKRLNSRPIVYQTREAAPGRGTRGAGNAGLLGLARDIVEQLLRNFTERLLKRDAFLWVFYAHLLILYAIAASCYAQTSSDVESKALRGVMKQD